MTKFWTDNSLHQRIHRQLWLRVSLPMFAIGALLLAAGLYGAYRVHQMQQREQNILDVNQQSIRIAEEFETQMREFRIRLQRYLETDDVRYLELLARSIPHTTELLTQANELAKTAREQQLLRRIQDGYDRLLEEFHMAAEGKTELPPHFIFVQLADEVIPNKILVYTTNYIDFNQEESIRRQQQNRLLANQLIFGLLLLGTAGGIAGLSAGSLIAHRVKRAIVQLSLQIQDTAGKLNEAVGPVEISAEPGFEGLESVVRAVSRRVTAVVEKLHANEREMLRAEQLAALGQLAAGVAHELRNPLTSMKTIIQLAERPQDLTATDLKILSEEICRLEDAVQTFLDFARPPQLEKRKVDLAELLKHTIRLLEARAERQRIDLQYQRPDHRLPVVADKAQIHQVVLNLLLNAFDAVGTGGTVRIDVREQAALAPDLQNEPEAPLSRDHQSTRQQRWAVISVCDSGPGMDDELRNRIFDPFVSTKETGTGLGLSICKRIAEAHQGSIHAENRLEGGAMFQLRLPMTERLPEGSEGTSTTDASHDGELMQPKDVEDGVRT